MGVPSDEPPADVGAPPAQAADLREALGGLFGASPAAGSTAGSATGSTSANGEGSTVGSELAVLGDLLGARVVDAQAVESSVIDRCDTAAELQRQRGELAYAEKEVSRIEGRQRLLERSERLDESGAERLRLAEELPKAQAKARDLRANVQRLEQRAKEHQEAAFMPLDRTAPPRPNAEAAPAPVRPSAPSPALAALAATLPPSTGLPRWGRLKSTGSATTTLTFDDDDDEDEIQLVPSQRGVGVAGAAQVPAKQAAAAAAASVKKEEEVTSTRMVNGVLVRPSKREEDADSDDRPRKRTATSSSAASTAASGSLATPPKPPPKARDSKAAVSAREYLSRLKASKVSKPSSSELRARQLAIASAVFSAAKPKPAVAAEGGPGDSNGTKQQQGAVVKQEASSDEEEADPVQPPVPITDGSSEDVAASAGRRYQIDVNQLVPSSAQDVNRWKAANRAEWKALVEQGETVSPHRNLLKALPGVKRKKGREEEAAKPKVRRESDTSDKTFERRQVAWQQQGREPCSALLPKQQVDEAGVPLKAEGGADGDGAAGEADAGGTLHDDVRVAEGLRCPRWLWEALYPYQHTCVRWLWGLHQEKLGGILADEMGLGKTVQIAAYLAVLHHSGVLQNMHVQNASLGVAAPTDGGGILIVAPATLVMQWRSELNLWYPPLRVCVMHQVDEQERKEAIRVASSQRGVLITSYETMRIASDDLLEASWVMMVLDEGQKIRNPNASITLAAKRFSTPHRIILSGSPIQNNLQELWSLFDFICPGRLGTLPVFMEEFAHPIEQGNLVGANQARVATAYECALALRELTQPCVLRRTKAECMDVLQLPHKQEQVLFCHLTPEQYQVYIDFLQTEQVRRAMTASRDRKNIGAVFFSISVLRKLCNHPDLLLLNADKELQPPDMWSFERSGKMKVLAEIMKLWRNEGHRALIFVQTIQMLEVIQSWMNEMCYAHLRIDGKTPVKRRLKLIEEFNANVDYFAMILTTRVGGVGLNIIGANRVVIFDPDWNPMTDVQARERAWRIGQRRDVAVYRLVLTGSIEEKVYQRQVYKHFLSQKILSDPRQRQFFKWNDMADLFSMPPMPPKFDPQAMVELREKYKSLFKKFDRANGTDELTAGDVETTEIMQAISDLPTTSEHQLSKEAVQEHNAILQTLFDSNGIKASFNHDKVEQPLLDRKIVRDGASLIAQRALAALQKSSRERANHHISEPTWTGREGTAGAVLKQEAKVKREPGIAAREAPPISTAERLSEASGVSSTDILNGLRQLAAIRSMAQERNASQSVRSSRPGLWPEQRAPGGSAAAAGAGALPPDMQQLVLADTSNRAGLPTELHASDRKIGEMILSAFLDPRIGGRGRCLTTGQVLQVLASNVAAHHNDLFKTLLKQMCELSKPAHPREPGVWTLRREFWPSGNAARGS